MSDSTWPHRRQPTRLPCPWDSPGKNTGVDCHFLLQCMKVKSESEVAQSCPTLRDPMDCSPSGSSVHGIFQARVLECDAIAFSNWECIESINRVYTCIYTAYIYIYIVCVCVFILFVYRGGRGSGSSILQEITSTPSLFDKYSLLHGGVRSLSSYNLSKENKPLIISKIYIFLWITDIY